MIQEDQAFVEGFLIESANALQQFSELPQQRDILYAVSDLLVSTMRAGGKLLIAGNGGSAGDAQHIATEFTGRMLYDRPPLAAIALHADTSALTAIGNDYGFAFVFERQVQALGRPGDVLLALSTSGRSDNIVRALKAAKQQGLRTIGFTGASGGLMLDCTDLLLRAPSTLTPVIQQIHMVAAHVVSALVERAMFPKAA